MKTHALFVVLILSLTTTAVQAAFYQWEDANGVVHFTDSRKKIPAKYRKKAKELTRLGPSRPTTAAPAPAAPAPAAPAAGSTQGAAPGGELASPQGSPPVVPGGHGELWWRERYASLRRELQLVREGLAPKQAQLDEARHKRRIYFRGRDREEVNRLEAEVAADELRIAQLLRQLDVADQEATREGIPFEWRQ